MRRSDRPVFAGPPVQYRYRAALLARLGSVGEAGSDDASLLIGVEKTCGKPFSSAILLDACAVGCCGRTTETRRQRCRGGQAQSPTGPDPCQKICGMRSASPAGGLSIQSDTGNTTAAASVSAGDKETGCGRLWGVKHTCSRSVFALLALCQLLLLYPAPAVLSEGRRERISHPSDARCTFFAPAATIGSGPLSFGLRTGREMAFSPCANGPAAAGERSREQLAALVAPSDRPCHTLRSGMPCRRLRGYSRPRLGAAIPSGHAESKLSCPAARWISFRHARAAWVDPLSRQELCQNSSRGFWHTWLAQPGLR